VSASSTTLKAMLTHSQYLDTHRRQSPADFRGRELIPGSLNGILLTIIAWHRCAGALRRASLQMPGEWGMSR
jgi:hypothetical protein